MTGGNKNSSMVIMVAQGLAIGRLKIPPPKCQYLQFSSNELSLINLGLK